MEQLIVVEPNETFDQELKPQLGSSNLEHYKVRFFNVGDCLLPLPGGTES